MILPIYIREIGQKLNFNISNTFEIFSQTNKDINPNIKKGINNKGLMKFRYKSQH